MIGNDPIEVEDEFTVKKRYSLSADNKMLLKIAYISFLISMI